MNGTKFPEIPNKVKKFLDFKKLDKVIYQIGENDGDSWICIGKRADGYYLFFEASCDYTGFDCEGGGQINYSKDWEYFWNKCLTNDGRNFLNGNM